MNHGPLAIRLILSFMFATALGACKRSNDRGDGEPIKGRSSDPAVTFVGRWDETNHFIYHIESITGTPVQRRNSDVVVQQDTVLGKDLRFGVLSVTPEGFRSLQMEVQAIRVETTSDERLTSAFDTENELLSIEDNAIASRLRRAKGARLSFRLSPANKVLRVDWMKEFNDRVGMNRSVRGAAGAVLNRFFSQPYYRDMIEMSFLPTNAVRVGDSWTVLQRSGAGLFDGSSIDLTYTFRGWQSHRGTNCARFDFTGTSKPSTPSTAPRRGSSSSEDIDLDGTVWFSPELGVPVETIFDQSVTRHIVTTRLVRPPRGTNAPTVVASGSPGDVAATDPQADVDDDPPPPPNTSINTNTPPGAVTTTTRTSSTKQHVRLTLIEVVPVTFPPAPSK